MFHYENSYYIPNTLVHAWSCKTNLPSNTAFRGFGGPQGMFAGEHIIRDVAHTLGRDPIEIGKKLQQRQPTSDFMRHSFSVCICS